MIFACDLDNTLIHSYKTEKKGDVCVEWKDGKELSFMSRYSYDLLNDVIERICFVPVTTRSSEQFGRIRFGRNQPQYALIANGGVLLRNGNADRQWLEESSGLISDSVDELYKAMRLLESDKNVNFDIRLVDNMFVFTKSAAPELTLDFLNKNIVSAKADVFSNGSKIYVLPKSLNKANALKRFKLYKGDFLAVAAGDSEFDVGMLEEAQVSFVISRMMCSKYGFYGDKYKVFENNYERYADFILTELYNILQPQGERPQCF